MLGFDNEMCTLLVLLLIMLILLVFVKVLIVTFDVDVGDDKVGGVVLFFIE